MLLLYFVLVSFRSFFLKHIVSGGRGIKVLKEFVQFKILSCTLKILFYLTLQYCIGFAKYQNESATGIHVFPILNPPPSPYPPSGSSQCTSPKHPVSCIEPGLVTRFIYDIIHVLWHKINISQIYLWSIFCSVLNMWQ